MESSHGGRASASRGLQDPSFTHEQLSHFKISVFTGALHEKVTLCCCGEDSVFPMVEHVFIQVTENTLITCGWESKPCLWHRTYISLTYHNISPLILMLPVSWQSHSWLIHIIKWKTVVYHDINFPVVIPVVIPKGKFLHIDMVMVRIRLGGISNKWGVVLNHRVWIMSPKMWVNNQLCIMWQPQVVPSSQW